VGPADDRPTRIIKARLIASRRRGVVASTAPKCLIPKTCSGRDARPAGAVAHICLDFRLTALGMITAVAPRTMASGLV
jgi:hypothetical protein